MSLGRLLFVALLAFVVWNLFQTTGSDVSAADISPEHEVVMFSAPWCGYCDQARDFLKAERIDFLEIDIESSTDAQRRFREAGGRGVPLTFIGDERLIGFSAPAYGQALDRL
jgi:glutaredoxin